jgi:hypothetical protein
MTEVFVYVEGPSDKLGMESLLSSVIKTSLTKGNSLTFISMNGKDSLLKKGPAKALNILRNRPDSWVFLVPDLYPRNKVFAHTTYNELKNGLVKRFTDDIQRKTVIGDSSNVLEFIALSTILSYYSALKDCLKV